jgi:hypothetical protein
MQSRDPFRDGETQAGTSSVRNTAAARDVGSVEALEDVRLRLDGNPWTAIGDDHVVVAASALQ